MNRCIPCGRGFRTDHAWVKHMNREHGIDRSRLWMRVRQAAGDPLAAVRTVSNRWMVYQQQRF